MEGGDDAELPHLPAELWSHVLSFVGGHDLVAFSATSWRAHALATRPFLWRSKVEERAGHVAGESEEQAWREADGATSWQQAWANLERKCHRVRCGGCRRGPVDGPLFKCLTCSERLDQASPAALSNDASSAARAATPPNDNNSQDDAADDKLGAWYYCRNCEGDHPRDHLLKKMRVREADLAFERCKLRTDLRPITFTTDDDQECFLCHKEIRGPCYARRLSVDEFRWKCMQCLDFDYCEACEARTTPSKGEHPHDHAFLKLTCPKFNAGFLLRVMTPAELASEWASVTDDPDREQ